MVTECENHVNSRKKRRKVLELMKGFDGGLKCGLWHSNRFIDQYVSRSV
jgi:ribosomal protein L20